MNVPPRPNGMPAVLATFGDPHPFADDPVGWEQTALGIVTLPTPLIYAVDPTVPITRVRAHKLIVQHLADTLMACLDAGVPRVRLKYGGCYSWRLKRGLAQLSLHTFGIAIDLEPQENPLDAEWVDDGVMLDPRIVQVFADRQWFWGGNFEGRKDPMHHQFAVNC